jgi:hypothetical protein
MLLLKIVYGRCLRPDAETIYGHDFTAVGQIHDGRRYAEEIALVGMHDV